MGAPITFPQNLSQVLALGNTAGTRAIVLSDTAVPPLQFGGTTASFPAIKRSGAALAFRLADDTADAAISSAGITANNGTITADSPILSAQQGWNNAAVTFTGIKLNVVHTASAGASLFLDLQLSGSSKFSVGKFGDITGGSLVLPSGGIRFGGTGVPSGTTIVGTGQTVGADTPLLDLSQTWNNVAVGFTALKLDVTNSASASTSRVFDFKVGGVSALSLDPLGTLTASGSVAAGAGSLVSWTGRSRMSSPADGNLLLTDSTGVAFGRLQLGGTTSAFPAIKRSSATIAFRLADDTADAAISCAGITASGDVSLSTGKVLQWNADTKIARLAAVGTFGLSSGATGCKSYVFGTTDSPTSPTNYEALTTGWSGTTALLRTQQGGTGVSRDLVIGTEGTSSNLYLQVNSTSYWIVAAPNGHFLAATDNANDIGSSGANRPRTIYVGTSVVMDSAGTLTWVSRSKVTSPSDGVLLLANNAGTDFSRLQLGGTTSSFPAWARNGAGFNAVKADLSAQTDVSANAFAAATGGSFTFASRSVIQSTADGDLLLTNNAGSSFGKLALSSDTVLSRFAAGSLGLSNSTSATEFNVYNTTDSATSPTNYERGTFGFRGNALVIGPEKGGTGTGRGIVLQTSGTNRWQWTSGNGDFLPATDNTVDIGETSVPLRVRGVYAVGLNTQGSNGQNSVETFATEEITLNTGATTTDSSADLLPADAIILAVTTRVTTTITTAANFSVGDPTTATRFASALTGLTAGSTSVGLRHQAGSITTDATGPTQAAAAKIRITTNVNPGAGKVRVTVHYKKFTAATS